MKLNQPQNKKQKPIKTAPQKAKKGKKKGLAGKIILSILGVMVLCVAFVCIYVVSHSLSVINGDVLLDLDKSKIEQNETTFVYAYNEKGEEVELARLHGTENRVWVESEDIPDIMKKATIAIEDKRFEKHKGVDWYRLTGVITSMAFDEGASTITQQLVKNLTNEKEVTIVRKFNEILSALNLEKNYDKDKIITTYLNTLYLGNGCYGVQTAAEFYFGKDVWDLTVAECASILAITQAPTKNDPMRNPENNKVRQEYCLSEMLSLQYLTKEEHDAAVKQKLVFTNDPAYVADPSRENKNASDNKINSYFVDYVIKSVKEDLMEHYGYTSAQAMKKINYGGLKIYTTMDPKIQSIMEDVYVNRKTMPVQQDTADNPAVQSAMTVMDYEGHIVGMVGGAGEKKTNMGYNRAISPRQPGSSIKPLSTYAPSVELNYINWSSLVLNYALPINGKLFPTNSDGTFGTNSNVTVQYAIQVSLNTVPTRIILQKLSLKTSYEYLEKRFHLGHLDEKNDPNISPLATGALTKGATTLEMAAAYATFGNGGKYYEPFCYYEVLNGKDNSILLENKSTYEQAISEDTADVMNELLQTVPTKNYGGSGKVLSNEIISKTGTTNDSKDRWYALGTPHYVSAVWYGYDKPKEMKMTTNPASRLAFAVFNKIHADLEAKSFTKSGKTVQKDFCTKTGLLATEACANTKKGWYKTASLPTTCSCTAVSVGLEGLQSGVSDVISGIEGFVSDIFN